MARSVVFLLLTITTVLVDNIFVLGVTLKAEANITGPQSDLDSEGSNITPVTDSSYLERAYAAIEDDDVENFKKGNWLRFTTDGELLQILQKVMEKGEKALNVREYLFDHYGSFYPCIAEDVESLHAAIEGVRKMYERLYTAIEDDDVENFKIASKTTPWMSKTICTLTTDTPSSLSQIHQKVMEKGEKALNVRRYLFENYSHHYTMSMLREEAINILQISDAEVRKENLKLFRDSQRVSGINWVFMTLDLYKFLEAAIELGGSVLLEEMKELLFPHVSLHRIPLYTYRRFLIKAASVNNTVYKEICVWLQQKMPLRFTIPRNHPFSIERYNNLLNRMEVGSDEWLREASDILVPLDSELSPPFDKTEKTFQTLFATIRTLLDVPDDVLLRIRDFVGE